MLNYTEHSCTSAESCFTETTQTHTQRKEEREWVGKQFNNF
jgi:hypothetical protein